MRGPRQVHDRYAAFLPQWPRPSGAAIAYSTNHEFRAIGDGQRVRVLTR